MGWARPTLSWSLQCEYDGYTRQRGFKSAKESMSRISGEDDYHSYLWLACLSGAYSVLVSILLTIALIKKSSLLDWVHILCFSGYTFFACFSYFYIMDDREVIDESEVKIRKFEIIN